jgi:hypothetical protein
LVIVANWEGKRQGSLSAQEMPRRGLQPGQERRKEGRSESNQLADFVSKARMRRHMHVFVINRSQCGGKQRALSDAAAPLG